MRVVDVVKQGGSAVLRACTLQSGRVMGHEGRSRSGERVNTFGSMARD